MKPAVDWYCSCGKELGVAQQLGKKKADRKIYCLKCARELKGGKK